MTPADLRTWQARMGFATRREACDALGMGLSAYSDLATGVMAIRRPLALACAALEAGLTPVS